VNSIVPVALSIPIKNISPEGFWIFLQKRVEKGSLNGFLEFPGGKIQPKEKPEDAALRELREETGFNALSSECCYKLLKIYPFSYLDRSVCLYAHIMRGDSLVTSVENWHFIPFSMTYENSEKFVNSIIEASRGIIFDLVDFIKPYSLENCSDLLWK